MRNPYMIEGPTTISFSGGRTSGYMVWRILDANGGLPDCAKVLFANTGKEMPETLDFVQECSERWGVPITWLEYCYADGKHTFAEVDWHTASRNGEPFAQVIKHRRMLPNPRVRFCTVELKVRTMHRYLKANGWTEWTSVVGIRADEPRRVAKLGNQDYGSHEVRCAPLATDGVTAAQVGAFWAASEFDLRLPNHGGKTMHGNCDLCFLKGGDQVLSLIRERPERAVWWMQQEAYAADTFVERNLGGAFRFRLDRPSYAQMHNMANAHGELFCFADDTIEDCACTD